MAAVSQADLLVECCQSGKVKRIIAGHEALPEGVVAVTFGEDSAATTCASKMSGRWFDGRQLETKLYIPDPNRVVQNTANSYPSTGYNALQSAASSNTSATSQYSIAGGTGSATTSVNSNSTTISDGLGYLSQYTVAGDDGEEQQPLSAEIEEDVGQVEDFLNSLL
jgi:hypothetical protein